MNTELIVTENDDGVSLVLPGEWSCENIEYDDNGNSITTYHFGIIDTFERKAINRVLDDASGVIGYHWHILHRSGTPPDTSLFLGEARKAWLRGQCGIQPTIHRLIDQAMGKND